MTVFFVPGAWAQVDVLNPAARVYRPQGEIAGFMRLVHIEVTPEEPSAAQTVRVDFVLNPLDERNESGAIVNGDSVIFIQAFGDWFPTLELSTMVRDRTRNSFIGYQNLSFTFQAPVTAGRHRVRILLSDSGVPMTSFFGGNVVDPNASARMWIEFDFFIRETAEAIEIQQIPEPEFRWQPEALPFVRVGNDFCDPDRFVPPSGGKVDGVAAWLGYELFPRTVHPGDPVALTFRLRHDPDRRARKRHVVLFGSWSTEAVLAAPIEGTLVGDLPAEDILIVRFPAPREVRDHRIRVMIADGEHPPRGFFGGFDAPRREQESPEFWTEIPLRVRANLNMFTVAREAEKLLIFDEMPAEKQVPIHGGGGVADFLTIDAVEASPAEPEAGQEAFLNLRMRKGRTADPSPIHVRIFGSWNDGAMLAEVVDGKPIRALPGTPRWNVPYKAPEDGGAQRLRIAVTKGPVVRDFFGRGVTREYQNLLYWAELPLPVRGGAETDLEAEAARLMRLFLEEGRPMLEHQPVIMAAEGVDHQIFTTVVAPHDVDTVQFHFKHYNDAAFRAIPMAPFEEREKNRRGYLVRLSGTEHVYPEGFRYYISVTDQETRTGTLPFHHPEANAIRTIVDKDDDAPIIMPLLPTPDARVMQPALIVRFHVFEDPEGIISGVDPNSLVMTLNGERVFPEMEVLETRFEVPYRLIFSLTRPGVEIKDGRYTVTVAVRDMAGNPADTVSWSFQYRNSVRRVGPWTWRGTSRSNYQHFDLGHTTVSEGMRHTENQSLEVSGKISEEMTFRAGTAFAGIFPGQEPRATRGTTSEKLTTAFLSLDSRRMALSVGDVNAQFPSGATGRSSIRGVTTRLNPGRYEIRGFYEPELATTSGLTSYSVDRARLGASVRLNMTEDASSWTSFTYLNTDELPILSSIGMPPGRGHLSFIEMNWTPFKGERRSWTTVRFEQGWSNENAVRREAFKANMSGRLGALSYRYEEIRGEPDFGRMNLSTMRTDFSGRTVNLSLGLFQHRISLSAQGGRGHDNILRQRPLTTVQENMGAGIRLSFPKLPSLGYNYSAALTRSDLLPRTQDARNRTHSANLSHTVRAFGLSGAFTQTLSEDLVSFNVNRTTSGNLSIRYAPSAPISLGYAWSPSRSYSNATGIKTYNESLNFSASYRFWNNQASLNLSHSLNRSKNSTMTVRTASESLSGSLGYTPRWAVKISPSFNVQFQRSEFIDRMQGTRTRQETFNASVNANF